jgi:hypothetical protein
VASWLAKLITHRGVIVGIAAVGAGILGLHTGAEFHGFGLSHGAGLWDG